ncbi:MAG: FAD-binding protein [Streptosporangiales bacterium]|nr:FAD-binding protein [Streptosporangiales bacterium]
MSARGRYLQRTLRHELATVVGSEHVSTDAEQLQAQAEDCSWVAMYHRMRELELPAADVVVRPDTPEQVADIVRIAYDRGVPVVPRGGGTGSQGGTFAPYGGIALDLGRMSRIRAVDTTSLTVEADAGATGQAVEEAAGRHDLTLAHYPGSLYRGATFGGYLAARGSGVVSTKYGKAEDQVLAVEAVLPPGRLVRTPATPNHAVGPGLLQLLVGSEGTHGVITGATMRLDPIPTRRAFLSFVFPTVDDGLAAARTLVTARWRPAAMRLYDEAGSAFLNKVVDHGVDGVLLVVVCDGEPALVDVEQQAITEICTGAGGKDIGGAAAKAWWDGKYEVHSEERAPRPPLLFGTSDACCTFDKLPALYRAKKHAVESEFASVGVRYTAHFSHWYPWGGMIYDRFYVDEPPADPDAALDLHDRLWDTCIRVNLDAVMNDHHGVGEKLARFMRAQHGPAFDTLLDIRGAIDPLGLMNPGKLGFGAPRVAVQGAQR